MALYTIDINERSKEGRFFLDLLKNYAQQFKAVQVVKTPNEATQAALDTIGKDKTTVLNTKEELIDFLAQV